MWYGRCVDDVSLSIAHHRHAPNWVAEHLGASSRRPRHPFPTLMAGETPGRVPVYTALAHHVKPRTVPSGVKNHHHTNGDASTLAAHRRRRASASADAEQWTRRQSGIDGASCQRDCEGHRRTSTSRCTSHSRQEMPDTCSYPCHAQTGTTNRWCDPLPKWVKSRGEAHPWATNTRYHCPP